MEKTMQKLHKFATELGYWPSKLEWNNHAKKHGSYSVQAIYYHTKKSWEALRKEANFPPKLKHFSKDECIAAIQEAAKSLGHFFTRKEYAQWRETHRPDLPSHVQISNRCGSWNKAKEEAGLLPNKTWGREFSDEEVLNALIACSKIHGKKFSEAQYIEWRQKNRDAPNIETIRRRFGGVGNAKKALNLDYFISGPQWKYNEDKWREPFMQFVVDALNVKKYREWARKNNGPSQRALFDNAGGYEKALLEMLPLYMEKIKAGRRKR